jgi:hypothetical protein
VLTKSENYPVKTLVTEDGVVWSGAYKMFGVWWDETGTTFSAHVSVTYATSGTSRSVNLSLAILKT